MSDAPQNPFLAMFAQTQAAAQEMAKSLNPALASFTPAQWEKMWPTVPAEVMEAFMGKQFNPEGLDARTRLLLTLAGLTMQGAVAEAQIRMTVRHAIEAGATRQEIAETIGQMAMFAGIPAMQKAMELATGALAESSDKDAQS